jgi:predicted DsbA family dithiol-disulfide isomerase
MAMANPHIRAEVVEASEFPDMSRAFGVMGVPKTVINDSAEFVGGVTDEMFVNAILESLGKEPVDWAEQG